MIYKKIFPNYNYNRDIVKIPRKSFCWFLVSLLHYIELLSSLCNAESKAAGRQLQSPRLVSPVWLVVTSNTQSQPRPSSSVSLRLFLTSGLCQDHPGACFKHSGIKLVSVWWLQSDRIRQWFLNLHEWWYISEPAAPAAVRSWITWDWRDQYCPQISEVIGFLKIFQFQLITRSRQNGNY